MSRWNTGPSKLDRALILVNYTDDFGDDVLAALTHLHHAEGWT